MKASPKKKHSIIPIKVIKKNTDCSSGEEACCAVS
jgi:hypothetical protein